MEQKYITRIMNRLNLVIKVLDTSIQEEYYLFMKSSKLWSDINFVSARVRSIENTQIPVELGSDGKYSIPDASRVLLEEIIQKSSGIPDQALADSLAAGELDKVFGIKNFSGSLLHETIEYIDSSKTVNAITYYRHYFFVVTNITELNRLIGLRTIELISISLMKSMVQNNYHLHEGYNLSNPVRKYIQSNFWIHDTYQPLHFIQSNHKNRIGVLFSDIKGFGQLVKNFPSIKESESTQLMIKKYQHLVSMEIKSNGGYVVQTAGDAFMAIFKMSEDSTNDSEDILRIMRAALGILEIGHVTVDDQSMSLITRIGINIASIEEGFLGALDLREYTVFGKDVNIASRLEKKVDELAESLESFNGGLLFNISNCREEIPTTEKESIKNIADELINLSNDMSIITFRNRIIKFTNNLTLNYKTDRIFENVKSGLVKLIEAKNHSKVNFVLEEELKDVNVKEGSTKCIYIYKQN